jgi:hypothetical protein
LTYRASWATLKRKPAHFPSPAAKAAVEKKAVDGKLGRVETLKGGKQHGSEVK